MFSIMLPHENLIYNLQDGYNKGFKRKFMREVSLQDKSTSLNNEEKVKLYLLVVYLRRHQKINGMSK